MRLMGRKYGDYGSKMKRYFETPLVLAESTYQAAGIVLAHSPAVSKAHTDQHSKDTVIRYRPRSTRLVHNAPHSCLAIDTSN